MKNKSILSFLLGIILGSSAFAAVVCLYTGLGLSAVFNIGKEQGEMNKDFLHGYNLSQQRSAVTLIALEKEGQEQATKALWLFSSPIYWDHVNNTHRNEYDQHFSEHFSDFVETSELLRPLIELDRRYHDHKQRFDRSMNDKN